MLASNNNTYLYDTAAACDSNASRELCSVRFGGLFDERSSSTWEPYQNLTAPGLYGFSDTDKSAHDSSGTDIFKLSDILNLNTFPVGIDRGDGEISNGKGLHPLGVGINSTIMNALEHASAITSKTWSLFLGWAGAETDQQTEGSLVFGGYDKAKFTGPNVTTSMQSAPNCQQGLVMTITDIKMNLKNGSSPSILGTSQGSALKACIEPAATYMSLPEDVWSSFLNVSGSTYVDRSYSLLNFYSMLITATGAYGQQYVKNSTNREVLILSLQGVNQNDIPRFGKPFLSSAYVLADNDRQEFTLWQAQPNATQDLVALGPQKCNDSPIVIPSATPSHGTTSLHRTPKGTIGGAVIGGLVGLALMTAALGFLVRRRRNKRCLLERVSKIHGVAKAQAGEREKGSMFEKPELSTDHHPPLEMPTVKDPAYDLSPYEMPASPRESQLTVNYKRLTQRIF
ncbi:uncharacterized protein KY384_003658 [Bacidia gigantensis]|uniref:uncharacterized protein n=1 Tax=Bacidia gigantensis TaxID=2732470 RepID=UPI001D04A35C|nr:uncharacterized protein KY384_003658 [Bacidia gigantensis]KAG8532022.1 hypothetical protein KY384_003658 [Bacidia gigantensis]